LGSGQNPVERTAHLERTAVLHELQLQRHGTGRAESIRFDLNHGSAPYPPSDPNGCGPHVDMSDHLALDFQRWALRSRPDFQVCSRWPAAAHYRRGPSPRNATSTATAVITPFTDQRGHPRRRERGPYVSDSATPHPGVRGAGDAGLTCATYSTSTAVRWRR